ncbi:jg16044 [Pararge aegeria aegeria]|uniref:Jg16044 protein n=1 Tax=Pararge aegeria aegeria TaxID=348720 RepID=A0A8S4SIW0_9NEOP|nr:jg16044 [Pararge aegeria aegeria]
MSMVVASPRTNSATKSSTTTKNNNSIPVGLWQLHSVLPSPHSAKIQVVPHNYTGNRALYTGTLMLISNRRISMVLVLPLTSNATTIINDNCLTVRWSCTSLTVIRSVVTTQRKSPNGPY